MDGIIKKEMQIRARIESIFNKRADDFATKAEFDDYLEEREDIIFNLAEGIDVNEMEAKVNAYKRDNADDIIRNEARKAEETRQHAAAEAAAGIPALDRAAVSGTAAAFHGGQDAEPHPMPAGLPSYAGIETVPLGPVDSFGNLETATGEKKSQSGEQWKQMALASGWHPEMTRQKAIQEAFGSLLLHLQIST